MAKNEKTLADFNKLVSETKLNYLQQKMDYRLEYTIKEETHDDYEIFLICNTLNATKILYSHDMKFIVSKEMIMDDVKTLWDMKKELMKEGV
jgi:hypothetical protein